MKKGDKIRCIKDLIHGGRLRFEKGFETEMVNDFCFAYGNSGHSFGLKSEWIDFSDHFELILTETNLEKAKRLYRKGDFIESAYGYKGVCDGNIVYSTGTTKESVICNDGKIVLYGSVCNKWAEVIPNEEKPTVVQNKRVEVGKCYTVTDKESPFEWVIVVSEMKQEHVISCGFLNVQTLEYSFKQGCFSMLRDAVFTDTPERLPWLNYCKETGKHVSEEEFNASISKVESVEFVNGEELEIYTDKFKDCFLWETAIYVGLSKNGAHIAEKNSVIISIPKHQNLSIRKKTVKQPEIGSRCLFSMNKNRLDDGIGIIEILKEIDKEGHFIADSGYRTTFCKEIKAVIFKY